ADQEIQAALAAERPRERRHAPLAREPRLLRQEPRHHAPLVVGQLRNARDSPAREVVAPELAPAVERGQDRVERLHRHRHRLSLSHVAGAVLVVDNRARCRPPDRRASCTRPRRASSPPSPIAASRWCSPASPTRGPRSSAGATPTTCARAPATRWFPSRSIPAATPAGTRATSRATCA